MKKRFTWSLVALLITAAPIHAEPVRCLVVQLSTSTKLYYPTAFNPIATFEGSVMHLNTDAMDISTVAKLTVETVELVGLNPETTLKNGPVNLGQTLMLQSSEADIKIYNLTGIQMEANTTHHGDLYSIDMSGLSRGTYLLKAGSQSWKFIKH